MSQLVQACIANDITDLIIIHEHRGDPGTVYTLVFLRVHYMACSMTEIMPKVCKNPFSTLLAHSTVQHFLNYCVITMCV